MKSVLVFFYNIPLIYSLETISKQLNVCLALLVLRKDMLIQGSLISSTNAQKKKTNLITIPVFNLKQTTL